MQRRFVSDVSHELRTPLTTVRMAGDVLHDARERFDPPTARAAELLQNELDRFEMLLADLLEISRFDAGAAVLDLEDVNLVDLAAPRGRRPPGRWRSGAAPRSSSRAGSTRPCIAEVDPPPGRADRAQPGHQRHRLRRQRGRRSCSWRPTTRPPRWRCATTASGCRPGEAAMVFNRFWRADPARARTTGGTGLGLSISLEDAHLHGGWLQAWGEPGGGAQFRLTLPRRAGDRIGASPLPLVPADAALGQVGADYARVDRRASAGRRARREPPDRRRGRSPACWWCCWRSR